MSEWISVEDRLPESGRNVLATYTNRFGKRRIIVGCRCDRWKHEAPCDDECASEYSEEEDEYFLLEGWYEQQDNLDYYASIYVHEGEVTHWMPLPEPPELT